MDPVRAICTPATYRAEGSITATTAVVVTRQCYRAVPISPAGPAKYSGRMTTAMYFPGPRGSLDDGSLTELVLDSREVEVDVVDPRPWVASSSGPIDIPDDASTLIEGLAAYGA